MNKEVVVKVGMGIIIILILINNLITLDTQRKQLEGLEVAYNMIDVLRLENNIIIYDNEAIAQRVFTLEEEIRNMKEVSLK